MAETKHKSKNKDLDKNLLLNYKKKYETYKNKYALPGFEDLNFHFDIEDLSEKETDYFLRSIRRKITEKTNSYLRFAEIFLNPSQAPLFFMILAKNLTTDSRKLISDLYIELGKVELLHFRMEAKSDEKEEAETIKKVFKIWKGVNENVLKLSDIFDESWDKKSDINGKSYLG